MARIVLTDASPLIGLAIVDGLAWLNELFGTVWMPPEVEREVLSGQVSRGETAIREGLAQGWLKLCQATPLLPALPHLDEGEAACIRHALSGATEALLLMDERAGRAFAMEFGLKVAGTAAVIGMAKQRGLISSAHAVFDRLHRSDFRISAEVIRTVLRRIGEGA
jgi:predicted nucleic acid-binding protein